MHSFGSVQWMDVALLAIGAVYLIGYFFERGGPAEKKVYRRGLFVYGLMLAVIFLGRVFL